MYVVRERCVLSLCWLGYPVSFGSRLFLFGFRPGSWFPVFLWCICVWCRSEILTGLLSLSLLLVPSAFVPTIVLSGTSFVTYELGPLCVFITAGPIIKLCAEGKEDSEGHVL